MQDAAHYTALQLYELEPINGPVVILGIPGDDSVTLGFSPTDTADDFRTLIFPSKIAAELCRETILKENPSHPVKQMRPWVMTHSSFHREGYTIKPIIGTCPHCGAISTTGIAKEELLHCDACGQNFHAKMH